MYCLCKFLDYDVEQGAKAYCMVELVMGYIHVIISTCVVRLIVTKYFNHGTENLAIIQWMLFATYLLLMITLLLQVVLGWLMYFIGYRKRKVIMFKLWMIVATFNFFVPCILLVLKVLGGAYEVEDLAKEYLVKSVEEIFLYLLYIGPFGLDSIRPYLKQLLDEKNREGGDNLAGMEAGVTSTLENEKMEEEDSIAP